MDSPPKSDGRPSRAGPKLAETRGRTCSKNIEPKKVVTWAKTFTNEWREPFDRGCVCFRDVRICCRVF